MQLVLHAPFGSRINKAWGLALRKRFCRQFNFELQAAATEDALLLSLGPQHSFPLADVFRYLHPAGAREVLVQALLDAPVFQTRWRWNATISLAVPRFRGGRKVPPQLQRMHADDLLAAAFPDAAACLENIPGDREIPDHPLVAQTIRDCLEEAMDFNGLSRVLSRIHAGELGLMTRDTPEPSPISHEILNARPYAFLDDAPLEERRAQAVYARRSSPLSSSNDLGALDPDAIARVRDEVQPDPRDADELHDALVTTGFLTAREGAALPSEWFEVLAHARRAARVRTSWVAAERVPEILAVRDSERLELPIEAPAVRAARRWTREQAIAELLRGRLSIAGPTTAAALAGELEIEEAAAQGALLDLESQGVVLRGRFTGGPDLEFCDRVLLARIHRYTLNRLRAEIEPITVADFMRFLFAWQHVDPGQRLAGAEGLRAILERLDGFELPAKAWERAVLPARLDRYEPPMLDMLCLTGQIGWGRVSPPSVAVAVEAGRAFPVALFSRERGDAWRTLRGERPGGRLEIEHGLDDTCRLVLAALRSRGASFLPELARSCGLDDHAAARSVATLALHGLVTSDGFAGARAVMRALAGARGASARGRDAIGRWSAVSVDAAFSPDREAAVEMHARALLARYGVVFRRLLARETDAASWRELTTVYRRLEARGEIRGGRFVTGASGEQFALPDAVERLREVRRSPRNAQLVTISAADPLNLVGILTSGDRIRAIASSRIAYRNGVALAVREGDSLRPIAEIEPRVAEEVAAALARRPGNRWTRRLPVGVVPVLTTDAGELTGRRES
jgi:ATP-dependent Lhr-like helicase